MISAWWLLLIVPVSSIVGICITGFCAANSQKDCCSDCQYNCLTCSLKKEKSE